MRHLGLPLNASDISMACPVTHDSSGDELEEEENNIYRKPKGIVGLQNLGLTCYMNAAMQALSNSMPLSHFMLDCSSVIHNVEKAHGIAFPFQQLLLEIWNSKRPSYHAPTLLYQRYRQLFPMFRMYHQQDSQEFLRYFMDQLHEELKESIDILECEKEDIDGSCCDLSSQSSFSEDQEDLHSEDEYETCDSGVSDRSSTESQSHAQECDSQELPDEAYVDAKASLLSSCSISLTSGIGSSRSPLLPLSGSTKSTSEIRTASRVSKGKKPLKYQSIISDTFNGILLSSVQCLTCNNISSRHETFQDLSLPIPSYDQLLQMGSFSGEVSPSYKKSLSSLHLSKSCDASYDRSMLSWVWSAWTWLKSIIWGPTISLFHCLAAFFSADELKGDNMYSCDKCSKLRNGVKYSKVMQLPEILIIHLKRFRHEYMFSSKITQFVSFPLQGLDLTPFVHKDCSSKIYKYDLYSVICHHGSVGGGHYTAYAQNWTNERWYEFDDQYVTEVSPDIVANCEPYVLFYKKSSQDMVGRRQRTVELIEIAGREPSLIQFYISKQWINKFNTFSEPGPIDNSDFLCHHGGVKPKKSHYIQDLVILLNEEIWEYLHRTFGGGPVCTRLYECITCLEEMKAIMNRQRNELETFSRLHRNFQNTESPNVAYALSITWFRKWEAFVRGREQQPPGPIENQPICVNKTNQYILKLGSDYALVSDETWRFLHDSYGGGPALYIRYKGSTPNKNA